MCLQEPRWISNDVKCAEPTLYGFTATSTDLCLCVCLVSLSVCMYATCTMLQHGTVWRTAQYSCSCSAAVTCASVFASESPRPYQVCMIVVLTIMMPKALMFEYVPLFLLSSLADRQQTAGSNGFLCVWFCTDPCLIRNGGCSHSCANDFGRAICSCPAGMHLTASNRTQCQGRFYFQ